MNYEKDEISYELFQPEHPISGYEITRWVMHKIIHNPKPNKQIRFINLVKEKETEVFVQEWYDINSPKGYVNIVHLKEKCNCNKKNIKEEIIATSHRALYNACVDYIIKTT